MAGRLTTGAFLVSLVVLLSTLLPATSAFATNLAEAMAKAYEQSPDLQAARIAVREADEFLPQALAGFRPTLNLAGNLAWQQSNFFGLTENSGTNRQMVLELRQPLFKGGQVENSVASAEALVKSARARLQSVEQEVLLAAVRVYVDVKRDAARLDLATNNETILEQHLHAVKRRFEVGEVSQTDVAQSEARLARARAETATAESLLAASKASYERVIGEMPDTLDDPPPLPPLPSGLDEAVAASLENNPMMSTARFNEESARHAIRVELGKVMPRIDLIGRITESKREVAELEASSDKAIGVRAVVPLYEAGLVHSQIRQAKETHNRRRVEIEQARRRVVELTIQAWETLVAARKTIDAGETEVGANELALTGVKREEELGIRTVLDVLDAEQALLDSKVALLGAERNAYVAAYQILAAIGVLNAPTLGLPAPLYDPELHYRLVRNKWFGWHVADEVR